MGVCLHTVRSERTQRVYPQWRARRMLGDCASGARRTHQREWCGGASGAARFSITVRSHQSCANHSFRSAEVGPGRVSWCAWTVTLGGLRPARRVGGERAGAMRGIVRRCSHARVDIDLRSAASGTAFSTDDLHRHQLRRDGPAAGPGGGPGGGREAPQIRGTILYLGFVFTLFDQKERSGFILSGARGGSGSHLRKTQHAGGFY